MSSPTDSSPLLDGTRLRLLVAAAIAALFLWYGAIDPADPQWAELDLHRYEAMRLSAPHLAEGIRQPECFRLLGPWLAAVFGFRAVTWSALAASAALLWRWLKGEGLSERGAAVGVLLFACARQLWGQLVWNPYQAGDALGLVALLVALIAIQGRRWALFSAAVTAGLFARETPILALPVALVVDWRAWPWALPGVAVFAGLRLIIPPAWGNGLFEALVVMAPYKLGEPYRWIRCAGAFAPVTLVPFVDKGTLRAVRPELWALVAGTLFSSLFGIDTERLLLPMVPVVYLCVARAVEAWPRWAVVALLAGAFAGTLHHQIGVVHTPGKAISIAVTLAVTAGVTVLAVALRRRSHEA